MDACLMKRAAARLRRSVAECSARIAVTRYIEHRGEEERRNSQLPLTELILEIARNARDENISHPGGALVRNVVEHVGDFDVRFPLDEGRGIADHAVEEMAGCVLELEDHLMVWNVFWGCRIMDRMLQGVLVEIIDVGMGCREADSSEAVKSNDRRLPVRSGWRAS